MERCTFSEICDDPVPLWWTGDVAIGAQSLREMGRNPAAQGDADLAGAYLVTTE